MGINTVRRANEPVLPYRGRQLIAGSLGQLDQQRPQAAHTVVPEHPDLVNEHLALLIFMYPVAKTLCQNRATFSGRDALVEIIRYSQFADGSGRPTMPEWHLW